MTTWERTVTEITWESAAAPGITWTTVVGGTSGTTPSNRLVPVGGTDGQYLAPGPAWEDLPAGATPVSLDATYAVVGLVEDEAGWSAFGEVIAESSSVGDRILVEFADATAKIYTREGAGYSATVIDVTAEANRGRWATAGITFTSDGPSGPYEKIVTAAGMATLTAESEDIVRTFSSPDTDKSLLLASGTDGEQLQQLALRLRQGPYGRANPKPFRCLFITLDGEFPTDGSIEHFAAVKADHGALVAIASNTAANGGSWIFQRAGGVNDGAALPMIRNTIGHGEYRAEDINTGDFMKITSIGPYRNSMWITNGAPGDEAPGLSHITGVDPFSGGHWKCTLVGTHTAGVVEVYESDGTTSSKDIADLPDGSTIVQPSGTLLGVDGGELVGMAESIVQFDGNYTATGVAGVGRGAIATVLDGTVIVGSVALPTTGDGSGDVVGPSSATDGRPVVFDGTTGKLVKQGAVNSPDGLLVLDGDATVPDILIPSSIARDSEVTSGLDGKQAASSILTALVSNGAPGATGLALLLAANAAAARSAVGALAASSAKAVRLPSSARMAATGAPIAGLLVPMQGATTMAIAAGDQWLARAHHSGQTAAWLTVLPSATALTAGQAIEIAVYLDDANNLPGARYSLQSLVLGTTTGVATFSSGVSLALPAGPCWISIVNPSGNSGSVTLRAATLQESSHVGAMQNTTWAGAMKRTGIAASPSDLSSFDLRSAISTTEIQTDASTTFPVIGART